MDREAARRRLDDLVSRYLGQRRRVDADAGLSGRMRALAEFQSRRLGSTYRDLQGQPRYRAAVDFFLADLYGPHDLIERDRQVLRALDRLKKFLPASALEALARALELHVLSIELDAATAAFLQPSAGIDSAAYAAAYRAAGRRPDRERQIDLVGEIGELLDSLAHRPEIGLAIRLAGAPAHAAGYGQLHEFIARGYEAFRQLEGASGFLSVIDTRERALLHRLFAE